MRKLAAVLLALLCLAGFIAATGSSNVASPTLVADNTGGAGAGADPGG